MLQQKRLNSLFWYIATPIILVGLTILTYIPSLHYAFQFDDEPNILKAYEIRFLTLNDIFLSNSRWISKWISVWSYHFGKFEPFFYRCANVSFHIITGLIIYYFFFIGLKNLKENSFFSENARTLALLVSGVFLLHPAQTQTVSYIVQGQMEGLAGLFVMATLLCFLLFNQAKENIISYVLFFLMYICAFLSCGTKEIAIITPLLVLLTDWFLVAQGSWESLKKRWWIHAAMFTLVWGMYVWFLGKKYLSQALFMQLESENIPGNCLTQEVGQKILPMTYFMSQFKVILHYLAIFIWPFNICMEYDWKLEPSIDSLGFLIPFLGVLTIVALIGYLIRGNKKSLISFGLIWFFICISPRSSIIPGWELIVDYKTYLACVGWIFVLVSGLLYLYQAQARSFIFLKTTSARTILLVLLTALLMFLTINRNKVWESSYNFWEDIVLQAPGKARSHNNFGCQLLSKDKFREAIPYFKRAIRMEQGYFDPYNNLSYAYGALGRIDQAIWALKQGIQINPYQPKVYNNLATFLIMKNEYYLATKAAAQAIELYPYYGKAYFNKGRAHLALDEPEEAWQCFKQCCTQADFDNVSQGYALYGDLSIKLHKYEDAILAFSKLLEVEPHASVLFQLGNAYFHNKNFPEAVRYYSMAYNAAPDNTNVAHNLCEAFLENSQPTQALELVKLLEQHSSQYPDTPIQKAHAHHLLGNNPLAIKILRDFMQNTTSGDYIGQAMHMIKQFEGK
ncbi:tetratricopeptide repeat protein [bacterium]|nr:tetratricopeptide repeat protein [bacterium]MBT5015392.1 tetratricopeptide repeat protein [bacterium]